jgi:recombinational DNA repair protein RecR
MGRASKKTIDNRLRQRRFFEKHREEINKKRRKLYAARKKESKCPRCGKKLRSTKSILCKVCLEKARENNNR